MRHTPIPIGLPYTYGKLYGWTFHEYRHNPELETVEFFKKHLRATDRVADVGANIGYYTLQFATLGREVVAFEPSMSARACLKKATADRLNVYVQPYGVYSDHRQMTLYSPRPGHGMASLTYEAGTITEPVVTYPLRTFGDFDWVKIDVEGAELEVLKGMNPTNAVLEVARGILGGDPGIQTFFKAIQDMGYDIYFIVAEGETIPFTGSLDPLLHNIFITPHHAQ